MKLGWKKNKKNTQYIIYIYKKDNILWYILSNKLNGGYK